jgi:hypothetical protein
MKTRKDGGEHSEWSGDAAKKRVKSGKLGEFAARALLESLGIRSLQRIETGMKIIRAFKNGRNQIVNAVPLAPVAGDFSGYVIPNNQGLKLFGVEPMNVHPVPMIAEVKWRDKEKLGLCDLEDHQHKFLAQYELDQAIGLVVWVRPIAGLVPYEVQVARYDAMLKAGWAKGKPLSWEAFGRVSPELVNSGVAEP